MAVNTTCVHGHCVVDARDLIRFPKIPVMTVPRLGDCPVFSKGDCFDFGSTGRPDDNERRVLGFSRLFYWLWVT